MITREQLALYDAIKRAKAEERERCAQVAESFGNLDDNLYANEMIRQCAAAIRALKDHQGN